MLRTGIWCNHLVKKRFHVNLILRPSFLRDIFVKRFLLSTTVMAGVNVKTFEEKKDRYHCVILDLAKEAHNCEENEFEPRMTASVDAWENDGVRAITTYIPSVLSSRIPTLLKLGFDFHHANPGYVLMLKWLSETDSNNFPAYANHFVGVAGFVVNDNDEVLMIQERFGTKTPTWKFPGGGADPGEDIAQTAQREVFEETGIESEFVGILMFRHMHQFRYGCSDLFFVCLMKAKTTTIKKCEQEISKCTWVKLADIGNLYPTNNFVIDTYKRYIESKGMLIEMQAIPNYSRTAVHMAYRAGQVSMGQHDEESDMQREDSV